MKFTAIVAGVGILASCAVTAKEVCGASGDKYFDDGLIFHLSAAGVPYRRMEPVGVCVDERYAAQFTEAERTLERYFHEVANSAPSKCVEEALSRWAEKENLRYESQAVFDGKGQRRGSLFFLRSFTQEQVDANRAKLSAAIKDVQCGT